jgi:hypothetical protein
MPEKLKERNLIMGKSNNKTFRKKVKSNLSRTLLRVRENRIVCVEVLDNQIVTVLKAKTPQQRLAIAFNMWRSAKKQLTNYLRVQHMDWDKERLHREVVKRLSHGAI